MHVAPPPGTARPRILALGDAALIVTFEPVLDLQVHARVLEIAARLRALAVPGIRDVVPATASCAVHFDPLRTDRAALAAALDDAVSSRPKGAGAPPSTVAVPVCYGGRFGPDLSRVAEQAACPEHEVVRLHSEREYRVLMIGFLPGFPYMGLLHERLALPRLATPRMRVPAGSVAIAERQTGIYPVEAPGGWHVIGRTPLRLFDPAASPPARLAPGDAVRFVPIDEQEYRRASGGTDAD